MREEVGEIGEVRREKGGREREEEGQRVKGKNP